MEYVNNVLLVKVICEWASQGICVGIYLHRKQKDAAYGQSSHDPWTFFNKI